jgi:hypothetical protein
MHALVTMTNEEDEAKIRKWAGESNVPPPNLRPAEDMNQGLSRFGSYSPEGMEYRQLFRPKDPNTYWPFGDAPCAYGHYIFFHDRTGCAYLWCGSKIGHAWYEFGCDHKMVRTKNLGNCYNRYECSICGYTEDVDSSD